MLKFSLYILLAILVALILFAVVSAPRAAGAPAVVQRATLTPLPVVTPAPTYAPPAYPAPDTPETRQDGRRAPTVREVWSDRLGSDRALQ